MTKSYTLDEIRIYLESQDSFGDIFYNLSETKIDEAIEKAKQIKLEEDELDYNDIM